MPALCRVNYHSIGMCCYFFIVCWHKNTSFGESLFYGVGCMLAWCALFWGGIAWDVRCLPLHFGVLMIAWFCVMQAMSLVNNPAIKVCCCFFIACWCDNTRRDVSLFCDIGWVWAWYALLWGGIYVSICYIALLWSVWYFSLLFVTLSFLCSVFFWMGYLLASLLFSSLSCKALGLA